LGSSGGENAKVLGEGTGEFGIMFVMLMLVLFCNWLESRLKLGVEKVSVRAGVGCVLFPSGVGAEDRRREEEKIWKT
jgi:hypothetical protein